MKTLRALVACECSQNVCKALRAHGVTAFSCDLLPALGGHPEWHIQGDVSNLLSQPWDLVVAHPPCTYLSNAGATRLFPGGVLNPTRFKLGLAARDFFFKCLNANAPFVCVENPTPSKIYNLPPFSQKIQPYDFGHPYKKGTCLWLKNLPALLSTDQMYYRVPFCSSNYSPRWNRPNLPQAHNARSRSVTFPGIAAAMASQWVDYIRGYYDQS